MYYFDPDGNPIDALDWGALYQEFDVNARIGLTDVNGYQVSTVWLGINHNHRGDPPIIFETMIFATDANDPLNCWCVRYATKSAAQHGHEQVVACLELGLDPDSLDLPLA